VAQGVFVEAISDRDAVVAKKKVKLNCLYALPESMRATPLSLSYIHLSVTRWQRLGHSTKYIGEWSSPPKAERVPILVSASRYIMLTHQSKNVDYPASGFPS
jgi:hypothetical protein